MDEGTVEMGEREGRHHSNIKDTIHTEFLTPPPQKKRFGEGQSRG
jgi:hypothetical protein